MNTTIRTTIFLCAFATAGCTAGPHQLKRSVDDWDNSLYVQSPWMNAALHVVPLIPAASVVAAVGDFLVTDAIAFWLADAWDGHGTAFDHLDVEATDGRMQSLLIEGAGWLSTQQK